MMPNHEKKRWLLSESMFVLIEMRTSILKLVRREAFLMKPKHQYHKSQRGEWVYDAQSREERSLLCESMSIQIEIRTSILKLAIREAFLMKPNHQYH